MIGQAHICAHDLVRVLAHIFMSTRACKHNNAFGRLENVCARTHICAQDLLRVCACIFRITRERASTPMLSEVWKMCALTRTPILSHDWTNANM
jgi:hypothetical protein